MVQGERICVSMDQWPASFMAVLILEELYCVYRTDGVGEVGALRRRWCKHRTEDGIVLSNNTKLKIVTIIHRKIVNKEQKQQGS